MTFKDLVSNNVYPPDWNDMIMLQNRCILWILFVGIMFWSSIKKVIEDQICVVAAFSLQKIYIVMYLLFVLS